MRLYFLDTVYKPYPKKRKLAQQARAVINLNQTNLGGKENEAGVFYTRGEPLVRFALFASCAYDKITRARSLHTRTTERSFASAITKKRIGQNPIRAAVRVFSVFLKIWCALCFS